MTDAQLIAWLRNLKKTDPVPPDCLWRVLELLRILDSVCVMLEQRTKPRIELVKPPFVAPQ